MRRVFAGLSTAALLVAAGCGSQSYETRLGKTLEKMRYVLRLDANLQPAPTKGKLEQNLIYVRPPKTLEATPSKEFQLIALEPGKFDVAESFFSKDGQKMHVLARIKRPKNPAAKKAAPTPADTAVRGDFNADVLATLSSAFNVDLDLAKAKEEKKRTNSYKHLTFDAGDKNVQVYLNGNKASTYEVALVFEYPKAEQANL